MEKERLIKRFESKDPARKRLLFKAYENLICSGEMVRTILEEIHQDLGRENLVTAYDIYYCKRHFAPKTGRKKAIKNIDKLSWTDPNSLDQQKPISKFSKK